MFPNVEPDVRVMILQANDGRLEPSIDKLLEIAGECAQANCIDTFRFTVFNLCQYLFTIETLDPVPDSLDTLPPLAGEEELIRL